MIPAVILAELVQIRNVISGLSIAKNAYDVGTWAKRNILEPNSHDIPEQPFEDAFYHLFSMALIRQATGGIANPNQLTQEEMMDITMKAMELDIFKRSAPYPEDKISRLIEALANIIARDYSFLYDSIATASESVVSVPNQGSVLDVFNVDISFFNDCIKDLITLQYPPVIVELMSLNIPKIDDSALVSAEINAYFSSPHLKTGTVFAILYNHINSKLVAESSIETSHISINALALPALPLSYSIIPKRIMFPQYDISFRHKDKNNKDIEKDRSRDRDKDSKGDETILTEAEQQAANKSLSLFSLAAQLGGSKMLTSLVRRRVLSKGIKELPDIQKLIS